MPDSRLVPGKLVASPKVRARHRLPGSSRVQVSGWIHVAGPVCGSHLAEISLPSLGAGAREDFPICVRSLEELQPKSPAAEETGHGNVLNRDRLALGRAR